MYTNNFNQSSTGLNLELDCFYSIELSRIWFDENFHVLKYSDIRDSESILLYGKDQGITEDWERGIENLQELSQEQLRAIVRDSESILLYGKDQGIIEDWERGIENLLNNIREDATIGIFDGQALFDYIETYYDLDDVLTYFVKHGGKLNYTTMTSTGYSQGDYSTIIIPNKIEYKPTQKDLDNIIWNTPLYCQIKVDGAEFNLTQWLDDLYNYDKNTVIERFDQNVKHSRKDEILAFLKEQLPNCPDYV